MSTIQVAAVQLFSSKAHTPDQNRAHAIEMAERAASLKPDLVVLPEAVAMLCYPDDRPSFTYRDVSEPVPGATTTYLTAIADRHSTNIVAGLIADGGPDLPCQNTVVVIDRDGQIVGRYDKLHEPSVCRNEQAAAVGSEVPVFDLDFGRIGVFVCWDLISPEITSILALKGAQLLCFPHLMAPNSDNHFSLLLRARAVDTGIPIVAAGMRDAHNHNSTHDGLGPTCIIDDEGKVVAQAASDGADIVTSTLALDSNSPNRLRVSKYAVDLRPEIYAKEFNKLNVDPE